MGIHQGQMYANVHSAGMGDYFPSEMTVYIREHCLPQITVGEQSTSMWTTLLNEYINNYTIFAAS